ncbi:MAG TPA: ATP-binding cassette domain-containing protein [Gaiellaceae bacterium]|nr:ATP-binding cassette domain-containing protein [Gaiellaceae bacterium]
MSEALRIENVLVRFGGLTAVDVEELTVPRGAIVGIVGANGAGKTTLFDVVSGFVAPQRGSVVLDGEHELVRRSPEARARRGLGRSFQNAVLFGSMTVSETLAVALHRTLGRANAISCVLGVRRRAEARIAARVDELIELLGLEDYADSFVAELSTGTRRIVDLACVLAHEPSVLLLDEPSAGVAQREVEALEAVIRRVKSMLDCTFLIIEHDIPLIRSLSDELYAMEVGRVIAHGKPDAVLADPAVVAAYLGTDETAIARSGGAE